MKNRKAKKQRKKIGKQWQETEIKATLPDVPRLCFSPKMKNDDINNKKKNEKGNQRTNVPISQSPSYPHSLSSSLYGHGAF